MKKILTILYIILSYSLYAQTSYPVVLDSSCFVTIKLNTAGTSRMYCRKDLLRMHRYTDRVDLIYTDNNLLVASWNITQAANYGYTLDGLAIYLYGLLNSGCVAATPPPSPNAGDSLIFSELYKINNRIDTTQTDTSLSTTIQLNSLIDSTNKILGLAYHFDKSDVDTSLIPQIDYTQLLWALINKGYDTSQVDTSLVQVIQLQQIVDSLSALINKSTLDTTHAAILSTINDSINSKFSQLISIVDTTQTDTSLINYASQLDTIRNLLDTIRKYLKDTIDFEYHSFCYRSKIDSGVYEFSQVFDVRNPSVPYYMAFVDMDSLLSIFSYMNGTSTGSFPDFAKDYIPCDKWAEYLKRNVASDTLKTLVFKAQTKRIDGTVDTLYNCKGISFSVSSNATGNIIFYYGDGDQDVYDVATEQLPHWENGSFVEFLGWDASAIAGVVRINKLGCSDVPETICAKEKPIINCTTNTPIPTCVGWASSSGVWFSASGCWNTGQ